MYECAEPVQSRYYSTVTVPTSSANPSIKGFTICHHGLSYHHIFMSLPTEILLTNRKSDSERDEVDSRILGAFAADTSGPSDCLKQMDTIFPSNTGILVSIDSEDCPGNGVELASIYIII
jgi:hypothetical protein